MLYVANVSEDDLLDVDANKHVASVRESLQVKEVKLSLFVQRLKKKWLHLKMKKKTNVPRRIRNR